MVQYRRSRVPGGTFFFTVTLRDRKTTTLVDNIGALRVAVRRVIRERPFVIDAMVVLPEHIHAVWTLPKDDADYAGRWRSVKAAFTHSLARKGHTLMRDARGEYNLWQRRYWEHDIRDAADLVRHVEYLHFNPVKHGLVQRVVDWPYSTFHRYVHQGLYTPDWAGMKAEPDNRNYGE